MYSNIKCKLPVICVKEISQAVLEGLCKVNQVDNCLLYNFKLVINVILKITVVNTYMYWTVICTKFFKNMFRRCIEIMIQTGDSDMSFPNFHELVVVIDNDYIIFFVIIITRHVFHS